MKMITLLKITPAGSKKDAVQELLRTLEIQARREAGCLDCMILERPGVDRTILYLDMWSTPDSLRRHVQSPAYRGLMLAMKLSAKAPEIGFYELSDAKGLEWVEKVRLQP
jgi:quinol monooxygenase YgiN